MCIYYIYIYIYIYLVLFANAHSVFFTFAIGTFFLRLQVTFSQRLHRQRFFSVCTVCFTFARFFYVCNYRFFYVCNLNSTRNDLETLRQQLVCRFLNLACALTPRIKSSLWPPTYWARLGNTPAAARARLRQGAST